MSELYFPVKCPICKWRGSSRDSLVECYGDDYSDPYCKFCFKDGEGIKVDLLDDKSKIQEFIEECLPPRTYAHDDNHWYRIGLSEGIWKGARKMGKLIIEEMKKTNFDNWPRPTEEIINYRLEEIVKELTDE